MTGEMRREQILQMLKKQGFPMSGATLAKHFSVSRQVIVQDIALMRAENHRILSTNKGYLYRTEEQDNTQPKRVFYVKHTTDEVLDEFMTVIELGGKAYTAQYFGAQNLKGIFEGYDYREFWRLENAYEDLKTLPKTGDVLPENNYPMPVENGQVFIIDYHMLDGTVNRMYYRCDGNLFGNGLLATEQFTYHSEP